MLSMVPYQPHLPSQSSRPSRPWERTILDKDRGMDAAQVRRVGLRKGQDRSRQPPEAPLRAGALKKSRTPPPPRPMDDSRIHRWHSARTSQHDPRDHPLPNTSSYPDESTPEKADSQRAGSANTHTSVRLPPFVFLRHRGKNTKNND